MSRRLSWCYGIMTNRLTMAPDTFDDGFCTEHPLSTRAHLWTDNTLLTKVYGSGSRGKSSLQPET